MNKLLLILLAALLPLSSAVPGVSTANNAQQAVSGFVVVGADSGFTGWKANSPNNCTGLNTQAGQFQSAQGNTVSQGLPCALSLSGSYDLRIGVSNFPTKTQSYYSYVYVQDCSGAVRIYTTASATFGTLGSTHIWTWGTGSSPVFTLPCSPGNRMLLIFR